MRTSIIKAVDIVGKNEGNCTIKGAFVGVYQLQLQFLKPYWIQPCFQEFFTIWRLPLEYVATHSLISHTVEITFLVSVTDQLLLVRFLLGLIFGPEDGGSAFLRNGCKLPEYTASYPRK
jgi:hypothetical protein